LDALPLGLDATYIQALNQIKTHPGYMKAPALRTFMWVIHAKRPLRVVELQHALVTDELCSNTTAVELDAIDMILGACANLLVTSDYREDGIIRPIYYSVQEFFRNPPNGVLEGSCMETLIDGFHLHTQLTITCLSHLQFRIIEGPCTSEFLLDDRLYSIPFVWYASC
jgi:hypothetical protein